MSLFEQLVLAAFAALVEYFREQGRREVIDKMKGEVDRVHAEWAEIDSGDLSADAASERLRHRSS